MAGKQRLVGSARDEEPLVDGWVDWGWGQLLVGWDVWELLWGDAGWGVLDGNVGQGDLSWSGLAGDELLPCLGALTDNIHGVLLVLALAGESKLVLWLSVWDLVDAEPLVCGSQETWKVALNILNIVELAGKWVVDINDNDLPVSLLLVEKGHDTEDLDLLDLAWVADKLTNLADIKWIVITLGLGLWVDNVWVLPGLWEAAVVPEVSLVWEAVADEAELALLDILLDGVEGLLLGDLKLAIGPSWDLNDHVQDSLLLVGVQWDIVERRDWLSILLDVNTVLQGVWSTNLADRVAHFWGTKDA